jgi:NAD kinase
VLPRAVLVERPTEYRELLARHGTREQVRFFLERRGLAVEAVERRHLHYEQTRASVLGAVPVSWKTATVDRAELDRFLFTADDVVLVLGQDGLVANVAKYLDGQPVIGLDPAPDRHPGVLVPHDPAAAADLIADLVRGRAQLERRTMVAASLDDGQELLALNEVFVGHRSHQSVRYTLRVDGLEARQSSSGLIVATGTGATGWAASVNAQQPEPIELPGPADDRLAWFVREPWPSATTSTNLSAGSVTAPGKVELTCELADGAVAFGDGIERDRLGIDWGQRVTVGVAGRTLALVR